MAPSRLLQKRDCDQYSGAGCWDDGDWWWSGVCRTYTLMIAQRTKQADMFIFQSGYGVRYAVVALVFIGLALILFGAYFHARHRIRKGLQPLAYHRWLVTRRRYTPAPYPQNRYAYYQQDPAYPPQQGVPMQNMGPYGGPAEFQPPPPAYGNWEPPPVYQPPQGASKVAANQNIQPMARNDAAGEGSSASLPLNNPQHNNHTQ